MKNAFFFYLLFCTAYRISAEKPLIFEEYGSWRIKTGLNDVRRTRILSKRRRDLRGHQLVAANVYIKNESLYHGLDDYK